MRDFLDDRPVKLRRERSPVPASLRPFVLAVGLCLLAGMLVFLDRRGVITPARQMLQSLTAPVARQLTGLRDDLGAFLSAPRGTAALEARIAALERENGELRNQLLRLEQARVENNFLRQQLAIQQAHPWTLLGAEVTVRSPDGGRRMITIARGSREGLRPGMAVIGQLPGPPAALIGIVETAGPHTAHVLLITDVSSQVSGRVIHQDRAEVGLVQGQWQRGSRLQLGQITRDLELAPGDSVVTAGLTGALQLPFDLAAIPPNIPIGSVDQVRVLDQYQIAEVRPFVDPDQVGYVWVILSQDD
ncbi:MAG: rod shape-determining protein MreC [Chloroflexaceae bacterium]|nr:rod shape-determining protein MreC [Chloroflexaceae bacterium]